MYSLDTRKILFIACALVLSACDSGARSHPPQAPAADTAAYRPTATFQEIMDSEVDPSGNFIWSSVSTKSDESGDHINQPGTDEEWHELRRRAIVLAESANLIAVPGRRVANGATTVTEKAPLDVTKIQQRLDARHEELLGFANALREVSVKLAAAADKKDAEAIVELGGTLDEVCEACHKVFWYPDENPGRRD